LLSSDFSFHTSAFHLHVSTCICNKAYNGKEGVNPGSRWNATQLQKDLKSVRKKVKRLAGRPEEEGMSLGGGFQGRPGVEGAGRLLP